MPAEKHVEPFIELPERGARRGSASGNNDYQASRSGEARRDSQAGRGAESHSAGGCHDSAAEIRRAKGCSRCSCGTADQRPDFRHPQRMPLRLSESLCGCADRWRAGAAMPGKEQGKTLGRLRESRLRRQRRCSASGCTCGRRGSGRVKNCSCCARPAAPMSARFAAACNPAAAGSCGVWRPMLPSFRRPARTCCPSSRHDDHTPPSAVLHRSGDRRSLAAAKGEDKLNEPYRQGDIEDRHQDLVRNMPIEPGELVEAVEEVQQQENNAE